MTFLCLYISRWWRQTWDTAPYFTVVNQSEARISTEHGIIIHIPISSIEPVPFKLIWNICMGDFSYMGQIYKYNLYVFAFWTTKAILCLKNYCNFKTELYLFHVCENETCPPTLAALWKNMGFGVFNCGYRKIYMGFYPRPVLAFGYCRCQRLCVSLCVNHLLVRAITRDPFKLGSPNLKHRCKRPWLRSLLFCGVIDLYLQGQIYLQSQNLPHFELVHAITHHPFKLGPPNLDQRCKIPWLRSLLFWGLIELDMSK